MRLILGPTTNWRECNGVGLSTSAYPELFAVIGYTYGQGGNGSKFKLPNLKGKFITGVGSDDWNNTLNETGGRSDAILPAHNHDISDPGHQHDFEAAKQDGNVEQNDGAIRCVNKDLTTEVAYTGITIDDVEDGETNASVVSNVDTIGVANLPPYTALYYIIRIQ